MRRPLHELTGHYRGFYPTDESAIGMGEATLDIDDTGIKLRVATGLEIAEVFYACNTLAFSSEIDTIDDDKIEVWYVDSLVPMFRKQLFIFAVFRDIRHSKEVILDTDTNGIAVFKEYLSDATFESGLQALLEEIDGSPKDLPLLCNGGVVSSSSNA